MSRSRRGQRSKQGKKDPFAIRAKKENYPSRASYKLIDIQNRFKLIREGDRVLELGSSPGGWTKVALESGAKRIVAIDPNPMSLKDGRVVFLRSRMEDCLESLNESFDTVLSDSSPSTSGCHSLDQARSIDLGENALKYCELYLKRGGNLVVKVFQGDLYPEFFEEMKEKFRSAKGYSPKASKTRSSEIYVIGKSFKGSSLYLQ